MSGNRIVVSVQVSLDGRTAGPSGELDWFTVKDELHAHFVTEHAKAGTFLYGRRTYEGMAAYWPTADQDPTNDPWLIKYSQLWKSKPKAVLSNTLQSADHNTTVLPNLDALTHLQQQAPGDLYLIGSPTTITTLAHHNLIDEYQIYIHPVVLESGPALLQQLPTRHPLTLTETQTFDQSVTKLTYHHPA
ncbi:dihydrofolate reductase family protein [Kribbella sp. NPDC051587]|uniref:dihydrofolate reductase family protein n=1 Tax=Kribbella sp. NPDC051587 TaxID=3364119 RepID=UPI003792A797